MQLCAGLYIYNVTGAPGKNWGSKITNSCTPFLKVTFFVHFDFNLNHLQSEAQVDFMAQRWEKTCIVCIVVGGLHQDNSKIIICTSTYCLHLYCGHVHPSPLQWWQRGASSRQQCPYHNPSSLWLWTHPDKVSFWNVTVEIPAQCRTHNWNIMNETTFLKEVHISIC